MEIAEMMAEMMAKMMAENIIEIQIRSTKNMAV